VCAEKGTIKMCTALLEKGANPNYMNEGKNALIMAMEN